MYLRTGAFGRWLAWLAWLGIVAVGSAAIAVGSCR